MPRFHTLRAGVQSNAVPGSGEDLVSMESDFRVLLMSSGFFDDVEVEHTDDPDRLLIAFCEFRPEYSERDVASTIERLWDDRVRYPFWEAHSVVVDNGFVELQAATRESSTGHYITVHLVAQKAYIPAQRLPSD